MKSVLLLLALAALAGCESVITVTPPAFTPRLALTYTLSNQPPTAAYQRQNAFGNRNPFTGNSQGILENKNLGGRADATIELRDASGQVVEEFRPDTSRYGRQPGDYYNYGSYLPVRGYAGVPGQAYLLRASAPGVAAVEATMTLPPLPAVEAASFAEQPVPATTGYFVPTKYGQLTFAIPDPAATADYYVAYVRVLDAAGQYWGYVSREEGPNQDGPEIKLNRFELSASISGNISIMPVSDAGRNGQRIVYSAPVGLYYGRSFASNQPNTTPPPAYLELTVSSIPASSYEFYQSVQRYRDANDNPFAEPAPLRSNVQGGYGLFGGSTDVTLRLKL